MNTNEITNKNLMSETSHSATTISSSSTSKSLSSIVYSSTSKMAVMNQEGCPISHASNSSTFNISNDGKCFDDNNFLFNQPSTEVSSSSISRSKWLAPHHQQQRKHYHHHQQQLESKCHTHLDSYSPNVSTTETNNSYIDTHRTINPSIISEFGFDFDSDGILRHTQTGETFSMKMTSIEPSLKRQEIIRMFCLRLVRQRILSLNMVVSQIPVPGHPSYYLRVLHSKNFFTHTGPILILLQGGGITQAGIWAPRLLLHPQYGLQSGSQISLIEKVHECGYALAIINANENVSNVDNLSDPSNLLESLNLNSSHSRNNQSNQSNLNTQFSLTKTNLNMENSSENKLVNCNNQYLLPQQHYYQKQHEPLTPITSSHLHSSLSNSDDVSTINQFSSISIDNGETNSDLKQLVSKSASQSYTLSGPSLSWLLTGSNTSSVCSKSKNKCNSVCSSLSSKNQSISSQAVSDLDKDVCTKDNHLPCSSQTNNNQSVAVLVGQPSSTNYVKVLETETMSQSNSSIDLNQSIRNCSQHSTTIQSSVNLNESCTVKNPLSSNYHPISSSIDSSNTDLNNCNNYKIKNQFNDKGLLNDQQNFNVSLEDRLYGMWRHIVPHCKSNQILVWAHLQAVNAFVHPFKPMPGVFPGFPSCFGYPDLADQKSGACKSSVDVSEFSTSVNQLPLDNNSSESHGFINTVGSSCADSFAVPSNTSKDEKVRISHSNIDSCRIVESNSSVMHKQPSNSICSSFVNETQFNEINFPVSTDKLIWEPKSKRPRLLVEQIEPSTKLSVNSESSRSEFNNKGVRSIRRRHLSAGPILVTANKEKLFTYNLSKSRENNLQPEFQSLENKNTKENPIGDSKRSNEIHLKGPTQNMWFDRRICGPWKDIVSPEAARRAFYIPEEVENGITSKQSSKTDGTRRATLKTTSINSLENLDKSRILPGVSGTDSDVITFSLQGGIIPTDAGIWAENNVHVIADTKNESIFKLRLARAWQRKAERLWLELKNRVIAVVFSDSPDALDLRAAGVGWGLSMLSETVDKSSLPSLFKPSMFRQSLPDKVVELRKWFSQHSVNFVAASLPVGTRLNPQTECQNDTIPLLSAGTTEHDLIPSYILKSVFDYFESALRQSDLNINVSVN